MKKTNPSILVFASGTKTGGGSGFETMVRASRTRPPILDAWICAVVTNHFGGGVWHKAEVLGVHSEYWVGPYLAKGYQNFVKYFNADYVMLSGWLKLEQALTRRVRLISILVLCLDLVGRKFTDTMFTKRLWQLITVGKLPTARSPCILLMRHMTAARYFLLYLFQLSRAIHRRHWLRG